MTPAAWRALESRHGHEGAGTLLGLGSGRGGTWGGDRAQEKANQCTGLNCVPKFMSSWNFRMRLYVEKGTK